MDIVNFGTFQVKPGSVGIIFFENEEGQDWYQLRYSLTEWAERGEFINAVYGAWAMVDPESMEITNVEYDPSRLMPGNKIVLGIDALHTDIHVGQIYTGTDIIDKPAPDIDEIRAKMPALTARQLRLGLINGGILPSQVLTQLAAIPDPTQREIAETEWEYASTFTRTHNLIALVSAQLGLTPEQVDTMWMASLNI